ncbi:hypothetical protein C0Q70_02771 [Pomacea canaliculata]|uniref:SH3b domain-containing protein n=1 Tax=Pomacea canaliculata TaxID=400727 RepID=A0A2T7PQW0_POMCA|nr:hypothetical protein C0Q70_02771 [Pomacea canaliculata]
MTGRHTFETVTRTVDMRFFVALLLLQLYSRSEAAQCACATTTLNVRSAAGTSHNVVHVMNSGDCATYSGQSSQADGYTWLHVTVGGQSGWAASNWLHVVECSSGGSSSGGVLCHGNIDNLHPTGMHSGGTTASHSAVHLHITTLNNMKTCYEQVAHTHCIEASVIAAIASRESNGGDSLTAGGYGDNGHAWGILQCDFTHSGLPCKECGARTCCHIEMMVGRLLIPYINQVAAKHPTWSKSRLCRVCGVAAYNSGVGNVQTWAGLDHGTTGNDYSNDVIARAKYLKSLGWS